jgi:small-conductance mechanosensitive channel
METLNRKISVVEPVGPAIEQVKQMLFKPFDLGKWFVIGFCAWLANFSQNGGGLNYISNFDKSKIPPEVIQYCKEHIILIGSTVFAVILISVVVFVLLTWLSSRGKFMFLDCVVKNKAEIAKPWRNFKKEADSLFRFRLALLISTIAVILPFSGLSLYSIFLLNNIVTKIIILTAGLSGVVLTAMAAATIQALTYDFVMPIMYINKINTMAAWKIFWPVFWQNFWKISLLYFLFKAVLGMAIGAIMLVFVCVGCCFCCVSVVIFIPYVNAVVMLPISSFYRLYPLFYFRQYGAEFDVFGVNL